MTELKNNFNPEVINKLGQPEKNTHREKKGQSSGKIKKIIIFSLVTLFAFTIFASFASINKETDSFLNKIPVISQLRHLTVNSDKTLKGEEDSRINILLLGIGGKGHDGAYLTDTIMLASIDTENKKIALLSIPRDLSVTTDKYPYGTKINNINAFAEANNPGSGGQAISDVVSEIFDVPINYYVRVDFDGFKNIIDKIGGITVNVADTLDDYSYPIEGQEDNPDYYARYKHLHVEKGLQKMDGELALEFARSRHAAGAEGSDFARARRQQLIMEAVKDKLLTVKVLLNPMTISGIISELSSHISTNLQPWEMLKLWSLVKDISKEDIINKVLDNGNSGLLRSEISAAGAYILVPTAGDFSKIKNLEQNIFSENSGTTTKEATSENPTIEILNSTSVTGLGTRQASDLEKNGFDIVSIGNSSQKNFDKSVIYDLTFGEKIKSLALLKEKTGASATFELPEWLKADIAKELQNDTNKKRPDFILIIGQDANKTATGTNQ